jgi:hypothetical protein
VQAVFFPSEHPDRVVGRATWVAPHVRIEADDDGTKETLARIFRPTAVVVEDASLRTAGTSGEVTLQPGSLNWFMAAARSRAEAEGLEMRFVPGVEPGLGWDPAGTYRTFASQVEHLERTT